MEKYKPIVGLEIHVELKTKSKMFCQCDANYFGKEPNTNTCPVCLGLPGALPVPNKKAIEWCILIGKALNCTIPDISKFDRKHYFYPDLPKGYQISQYDEPIAINGFLEIPDSKLQIPNKSQIPNDQLLKTKKIRINRVHQEEDTGKLIHSGGDTLVDFNRSGVPLVEIVTEPDFDNADDVKRFFEELHTIIRYLGVSDADMEKGSMRLEPNISVMKHETCNIKHKKLPSYKVEVKNINSFRFVKQAIDYEIERQTEILKSGKTPEQETRGFDEKKGITYSQRSKEEAQDYRYFPEPDIPPLSFSKKYVDSIRIPELPAQKMYRYIDRLKLKGQDAFVLTRDKGVANYFEQVISKIKNQKSRIQIKDQKYEQVIANIIINKKIPVDLSVDEFLNSAVQLLQPVDTDTQLLETTMIRIIGANEKVVKDYKSGRQNALMFLVGQVMREMKGKADAKLVISKLKERLK